MLKLAVAIAAFAGAAAFASRRGVLACSSPNARFVKMTLAEGEKRWGKFSSWPKIAAQIRAYGGTCVSDGTITDVGSKPVSDDDIDDSAGGVIDGPITHPSQLG